MWTFDQNGPNRPLSLPSLSPGSLLPNSSLSQLSHVHEHWCGIRQGRYCQIQHFTVLQSVNFNFCHKHRSARRHSLPIQIRILNLLALHLRSAHPPVEETRSDQFLSRKQSNQTRKRKCSGKTAERQHREKNSGTAESLPENRKEGARHLHKRHRCE